MTTAMTRRQRLIRLAERESLVLRCGLAVQHRTSTALLAAAWRAASDAHAAGEELPPALVSLFDYSSPRYGGGRPWAWWMWTACEERPRYGEEEARVAEIEGSARPV